MSFLRKTSKDNSSKRSALSFKFHGNYCGPGYCGGSYEEKCDFNTPAVDALDQVCKEHDFNYSRGRFRQGDVQFLRDVQRIPGVRSKAAQIAIAAHSKFRDFAGGSLFDPPLQREVSNASTTSSFDDFAGTSPTFPETKRSGEEKRTSSIRNMSSKRNRNSQSFAPNRGVKLPRAPTEYTWILMYDGVFDGVRTSGSTSGPLMSSNTTASTVTYSKEVVFGFNQDLSPTPFAQSNMTVWDNVGGGWLISNGVLARDYDSESTISESARGLLVDSTSINNVQNWDPPVLLNGGFWLIDWDISALITGAGAGVTSYSPLSASLTNSSGTTLDFSPISISIDPSSGFFFFKMGGSVKVPISDLLQDPPFNIRLFYTGTNSLTDWLKLDSVVARFSASHIVPVDVQGFG